jgi:4-hydroxy-tetrahydrodipicolinate reductase
MKTIPSLRVCLYGLGAIGSSVARALLDTDGIEIVSAIDTDSRKAGRSLADHLGRRSGAPGPRIVDDPHAALRLAAPNVVVHCTGSRLRDIAPSLEAIIDAGIPCATSCEEMALPDLSDSSLAASLDARARRKGAPIVGAGVNPGFAMDALVLALSGATRNIRSIKVSRVLDPLRRRRAFRNKVGLGLVHEEAVRLVEQDRLGHVGLSHSAMLVARGLGWSVHSTAEELRILCKGDSPRRRPRPDAAVTGLHQTFTARGPGRRAITLEMIIAAGVRSPHDSVAIAGTPDLGMRIDGGIPGDQATVSSLINAMGQVASCDRAGLLTILDLPIRPAWHPGRAH